MKIREGAFFFIAILLLGIMVFGSGCTDSGNESGQNEGVKAGDTVRVDYVGKLENGTVFDTSIEEVAKQEGIYVNGTSYAPITFVVGSGQMIKGFDDAVIGMKEGEEKTITIPPEEAYGEYNESRVAAIPLNELNLSETPKVGQIYGDMYGNRFEVVAVNETHVTIDANHELAGKTLIFDIKLVSIGRT